MQDMQPIWDKLKRELAELEAYSENETIQIIIPNGIKMWNTHNKHYIKRTKSNIGVCPTGSFEKEPGSVLK